MLTRRTLLSSLVPAIALRYADSAETHEGVCPLHLHTEGRTKSGSKYEELAEFIRQFPDHLDAREAEYLGGPVAVRNYARSLIGFGFLEVAVIHAVKGAHRPLEQPALDMIVNAFVNGSCSDIPDQEAAMVFNTVGAFWNSRYSICGYRGGTAACRMLLVLHEFCHALSAPGFQPDLDVPASACGDNNSIVLRKFPRTLAAANRISKHRTSQ